MTAKGLGHQGSQAVGPWFESLSCQIFLRFIPNIFRYPNLVKHWRVPFRNFRHGETKIFDRKSWYSFPPLPPLLSIKFFDTRKFVKHEGFPYEVFGTVRQKKIDRKSWYPFPPPIQTFSLPEITATVKDSPTEIFGTVRQKFFDGKSWYSPLPPLIHKLFRYRKFSETQHRRVPLRSFSVLPDKFFNGKSWYPFA